MSMEEIFGEPIYAYTRANAIEDGELVDVSAWAREVGITYPVAMTRGVWAEFVEWPEDRHSLGQSERGRAHDVLFMLACAIRAGRSGDRVDFKVARVVAGRGHKPVTGALYSLCHGGDNHEPVITIMLPGED